MNIFLVALEDGYLLIDCGMETEPSFETMRAAMQERGIDWREIRQILLTHMHPDHMGLAARLLELTGASLAMHEAEARHLRQVAAASAETSLARGSLPSIRRTPALELKMEEHFYGIRKNFHDLAPARILTGGEQLETALGPLEVIWTSGHSPGHICLYSRERKLLFSGDQIIEKITPNIAWHPGRDMLAEFLDSLERLAAAGNRPHPAVARGAVFRTSRLDRRKQCSITRSAAMRFSICWNSRPGLRIRW